MREGENGFGEFSKSEGQETGRSEDDGIVDVLEIGRGDVMLDIGG